MSFRQWVGQFQSLNGRNKLEIATNGIKLRVVRSSGVLPGVLSLGVMLFGITPLPVIAQSIITQNDEAAAINVGESKIIPTVRFEFLQSNNAFLTDTNQTDTTVFIIKPRASWEADRRLFSLTGTYEGAYASYSEDDLNYADHLLQALAIAELSARQRLRASLSFDFGHQALGTGLIRGLADNNADGIPDVDQVEFINTGFIGSYVYGAAQARGNFELGLAVTSRAYQNERTLTSGFDFTSVQPFGRFSLRLSADTRAIATLRFTNSTFGLDTRDFNAVSLLAGLRFAATGKSGGEFQIGASATNYTEGTRSDETNFVAEAELFYEPSTFSRFELTGGRELDNVAGSVLSSTSVFTDSAELSWEHEWSSRFYHVADLSYERENGDCPNSDTIVRGSGGIEFNLVLQRWLHVGASFTTASRDETECSNVDRPNEEELDFESQTFGAHIRATL